MPVLSRTKRLLGLVKIALELLKQLKALLTGLIIGQVQQLFHGLMIGYFVKGLTEMISLSKEKRRYALPPSSVLAKSSYLLTSKAP